MARTETVKTRCSPEEKAALWKIARIDRRKPSEKLRELIRREAEKKGVWPPK